MTVFLEMIKKDIVGDGDGGCDGDGGEGVVDTGTGETESMPIRSHRALPSSGSKSSPLNVKICIESF